MKESITNIMDKEHKKIDLILKEFESIYSKDKITSKEIFSKFKWSLEKHFFLEEKAIFNSNILDEEWISDISKVLDEHQEIINLLEKTEDALNHNKNPELNKLKQLIHVHSVYEDEVFYPKMEEFLSEKQKENIINKTKEIIQG
ncbi:MAG: hemerythrin domain-containing protein [Candidatus Pacearchaeota archaeon]|jgi:hypothetical protein